jgi:hypothetical protein
MESDMGTDHCSVSRAVQNDVFGYNWQFFLSIF